MAARGVVVSLTYYAYNTSTGAYATGDVANHTIRIVKDGVSAAPTNSPSENDAINTPGLYTLLLTGTECTANMVSIAGKSSTANVILIGSSIAFENLPTAAPAALGGLITRGTGVGQLAPDGSGNINAIVASYATGQDPVTLVYSATLTEGYPTKGVAFTLPQALYLLVQHTCEFSISGTTETVKKRDQITTAKVFTLDSATTPAALTETT